MLHTYVVLSSSLRISKIGLSLSFPENNPSYPPAEFDVVFLKNIDITKKVRRL